MTHVRTSAPGCHIFQSFVVLKVKQMRTIAGLLSVWWKVTDGILCSFWEVWDFGEGSPLVSLTSTTVPLPTTSTEAILPLSSHCPMISLQLLCCCVTLPSVFYAHESGTNV